MPNVKKISAPWLETGVTVYAIIRREADGYRLNDADGTFASAPADPYLTLTEDSVIKGLYEASESRTAWNDGRYTFMAYKQAGGSPAPASDQPISEGEFWVKSDTEVAQTGDSFTRLGAPAGASVSADVAAVKSDTAATLAESLTHPTLAEIEATTVLAKEATVAARASQASLDSHETARASMETALVAEHDATQATLANGTYGLSALNADLDTLLARLTALRAGYLDNLSAGAVGLEATLTTISGYVDELEARLTATRAGYLDNLDATVSSRLASASYTAPDNAGIAAIKAKTDTIVWGDISFMLKCIKNKKPLIKVGSTWYLVIYDNNGTTEILRKALKDKDGNDITDVAAGILAQELASSV